MADPFANSKIKIERARRHIQEFRDFEANHWAQNPPEATIDGPFDESPHYRVNLKFRGAAKESSAVIGDAIHNLRASLDLAAVTLVEENDKSAKSVHFPFAETADELPEMIQRKNFYKAGPRAVEVLTELRPYRGGNLALRAIHDLDIQDKHQAIIPVGATGSVGVKVEMQNGAPVILLGDYSTVLAFPKDGGFAEKPIVETLEALVHLVESIINTFEAVIA